MKNSRMFSLLCLTGSLLFACQSDETDPEGILQEATQVSTDETQMDELLDDADLLVEEALSLYEVQLRSTADSNVYLSDCPVVTLDKDANPQVLTINFGDSCLGKDGKIRSGMIVVRSTSFKVLPSVRIKSFEHYTVNGRLVEGYVSKTVLKDSVNRQRTAQIEEDVRMINPTIPDTVSRQSQIIRLYKRNVLADKTDDEVVSWGIVTTKRANGVIVTKEVTESNPLTFLVSCKHIVSGTASFTNSKGRSWTIDYGDGTCDRKAIVTEDGKTKTIRL